MVEYTAEEQILLDNCLMTYKIHQSPDRAIDFKEKEIIVAAVDYCHKRGIHIRNPDEHVLMFSILDKNGVEVESPQARQARLAKERQEKIAQMNIEKIEAKEEEAKAKVEEIKKQKELAKKQAEAAKQKEVDISTREAAALKRAKEAEDMMLQMRKEIDAMKEEMVKSKNESNMKEAVEVLEKEIPEVIDNGSESNIVPIEKKEIKEKSVEELINELKLEE